MSRNGTNNLRTPTSEEARAIGALGGKKKAENMAKRKLMKEQMEALLCLPVKKESTRKLLKEYGCSDKDQQAAILVAMVLKAQEGDVRAAEFIRDIVGEKPKEDIGFDGKVTFSFKEMGGVTADDIMG